MVYSLSSRPSASTTRIRVASSANSRMRCRQSPQGVQRCVPGPITQTSRRRRSPALAMAAIAEASAQIPL